MAQRRTYARTAQLAALVALLVFVTGLFAFAAHDEALAVQSGASAEASFAGAEESETAADDAGAEEGPADEGSPDAKGAEEEIEDEENPLISGISSHWALANVVATFSTVVMCCGLLASIAGRRGRGIVQPRRIAFGGASVVPAVVAIIASSVTQDLTMPMIATDWATPLFAVACAVQVVILVLANVVPEASREITA